MNLRQLLAMPVAFAAAWVLVYPFTLRIISYRWATASSHVSRVAMDIDNRFVPNPRLTTDAVQRWIEGKTLPSDPPQLQGSYQVESDPWGRPLKIVERLDGNGNRRFAVFSLGRDGTSRTDGNDSDDINSWSDDPVVNYRREALRESEMYHLRCTIPWCCIIYAPIFFLLRTKKKTGPSDAPKSPFDRKFES